MVYLYLVTKTTHFSQTKKYYLIPEKCVQDLILLLMTSNTKIKL